MKDLGNSIKRGGPLQPCSSDLYWIQNWGLPERKACKRKSGRRHSPSSTIPKTFNSPVFNFWLPADTASDAPQTPYFPGPVPKPGFLP